MDQASEPQCEEEVLRTIFYGFGSHREVISCDRANDFFSRKGFGHALHQRFWPANLARAEFTFEDGTEVIFESLPSSEE
jgi:hypothetical protein